MPRVKNSDPFMLSVSGARGIVGSTMRAEVAANLAAAFGTELIEKNERLNVATPPRVVIGRDGRASGENLSNAAAHALADTGCNVVHLGVATTPTVGLLTRTLGAQGGLAITASHNPIEWNGVKFLDPDGLAPPLDDAKRIIARFNSGDFRSGASTPPPTIETHEGAAALHVETVLRHVDCAVIKAMGCTVVLDSVNASGCEAGRLLLDSLGVGLDHINGTVTGDFAHTPEPIEANLRDLAARVAMNTDAACGFAQDPDADRLAIVDENGRFIGEEYTLVLAALRMLQREGGMPLATNLSTSRMIDEIAAQFDGAHVVRTAVGEANVVSGMRSCNAPIGGEGNGGVIFPAVGWVRDSLIAMALVLELLATDGRPLSAIVDSLPRFAMLKRKLDLSAIGGNDAVAPALEALCKAFGDAQVDTTDGVRVDLPEGWVHLRASNTEPIIRLIAEARSTEEAQGLADRAAQAAGLS